MDLVLYIFKSGFLFGDSCNVIVACWSLFAKFLFCSCEAKSLLRIAVCCGSKSFNASISSSAGQKL